VGGKKACVRRIQIQSLCVATEVEIDAAFPLRPRRRLFFMMALPRAPVGVVGRIGAASPVSELETFVIHSSSAAYRVPFGRWRMIREWWNR